MYTASGASTACSTARARTWLGSLWDIQQHRRQCVQQLHAPTYAVALHGCDEVALTEAWWWLRGALLEQQLRGHEGLALLEGGQVGVAAPVAPGVHLQPVALQNHEACGAWRQATAESAVSDHSEALRL